MCHPRRPADRLASSALKDFNTPDFDTPGLWTGAPRRIHTVMPDATSALGRSPPRDANRQPHRGVETTRDGPAARAERVETRWRGRDIQWIDFTSEPDSGIIAGPIPTTPVATPNGSAGGSQRPASELRRVLHRVAAPAATRGTKGDVIPGLPSRFVRLPVAKLEIRWTASRAASPRAGPSQPPAAGASPSETGSVVLHPRIAVAATAEATPDDLPRAVPVPVTPRPRRELDDPGTFPASISTPVSTPPLPARAAAPGRWRATLGQVAAATGAAGRGAFAAAAMAATAGVARARTRLQRRSAGETPIAKLAAQIARQFNRLAQFVASRENRLRVSGIAVLAILLVALAAYVGGALLAAVTRTGSNAAPSNVEGSVAKQLALVDKVGHPPRGMPTPQANPPPTDPAARAAFYLAKAKAGDAAAQYNVGVLYARGQGLVQDYASAVTWFRAAAAQGNTAAQYNLGVLYGRGLGVAADPAEALNWYRSAADQNYPAAQFNLALAYAAGDGTKQDYAAARWYQRAAAQALGPAMVNLAILYEAGTGVEHSPVDAYAWYNAAGERGDTGAKTRAAELFKQFNERDKARAQGLAATIGAALDSFAPKLPPA